MAKQTVDRVDLAGKRVFLRVDFNVPLDGGRIVDDTRITAALPTIEHCLAAGASLVVASHLGRPKGKPDPKYSLAPAAARLAELIGRPVPLAGDCIGPEVERAALALGAGEVLMLENLRFHAEEEANDDGFARALAALGQVYVNDAFAAAHRAHASIEGITHHLRPAVAGLLMARELEVARPHLRQAGSAAVGDSRRGEGVRQAGARRASVDEGRRAHHRRRHGLHVPRVAGPRRRPLARGARPARRGPHGARAGARRGDSLAAAGGRGGRVRHRRHERSPHGRRSARSRPTSWGSTSGRRPSRSSRARSRAPAR